jgi:hypothetical protein
MQNPQCQKCSLQVFFLKKANKRNFFRLFFLNKEKYLRYLHSEV